MKKTARCANTGRFLQGLAISLCGGSGFIPDARCSRYTDSLADGTSNRLYADVDRLFHRHSTSFLFNFQ